MKYLLLTIFLITLSGCQSQEDIAEYTEIRIKSPQDKMVQKSTDPHEFAEQSSSSEFKWKIPEGWSEKTGTGMRKATITKNIDSRTIEMTVIELAGSVGGVEANLTRWLGQIGVDNADALKRLTDQAQTINLANGKSANVYDFTMFQSDSLESSMLAAIIPFGGSNLFIKSMGQQSDMIEIREDFVGFVESIEIN